jgi:hypothetical protein
MREDARYCFPDGKGTATELLVCGSPRYWIPRRGRKRRKRWSNKIRLLSTSQVRIWFFYSAVFLENFNLMREFRSLPSRDRC